MRIIKYDESELLKSLKEEDRDGLKYVYATYYPKLFSVLGKYGASQEDIKDIMQVTIVDVVRNLQANRFRGDSKLETYFIGIAKRKWFTMAKRNQKNLMQELSDEVLDMEDEVIEASSEEDVIKQAFERMKADCHKLLKLFYYESKSLKEIARIMEYSEGFVRVKKNRCMEGLKKQVFEHSIIQEKYPNASRKK